MIPIQQTTYYRRYSSQRISELATWLATRASQEIPPKERTQDALVHELPARYSAQRRFSHVQAVVLLPLAFVLVPLFLLFRLEALRLAISLISGVYLLHLGFLFLLTLLAGRKVRKGVALPLTNKQIEELAHEHWPRYSILVPLYRETAILPQLLRALKQIDYPQVCLEILLLVEEDDYGMALALSQADLSPVMHVVCVPQGYPRTKPRACNFGLAEATGDYLVIYDAEDIPDPLQLKRAVLTFAESHPRVACVQAQLNFYNAGANLLTRFFTLEYSLWFDLVLPGLVKLGAALPLGGTSNHFRTAVLRQLYGWDAYNVTEDADLGLRLSRYGFQTVMMEATTYEEATSQVGNWLGQRSRWIKGYIQTVLVQLRQPRKLLFSPKGLRQNGPTLGLVAGVSWFFLLNPLMWVMLLIYLVARAHVEDFYHAVFSPFALYAGVLCLFFGNLFFVVLAMCSAYRRRQYALVPYALVLPLYWVLLSVAAVRALYEFAVRPHHWQKTRHGLHLKGVQEFELADGSGQIEREFYFPANKGGPVELLTTTTRQRSYESLTSRVKAIGTMPVPIMSTREKGRGQKRDPFFLVTLAIAAIAGVTATLVVYLRGQTLLYNDSYSHLRIARAVFDNLTPGLAQLGSVWLPLPHLLTIPFVTNDFLWHSGLAGACVSTPAFIGASGAIYLVVKRVTSGQRIIALVGSLVFVSNANMLYLQATPLSESLCVLTVTLAIASFLAWLDQERVALLVISAVFAFLATLARYDGWALFLAMLALILLLGWRQQKAWMRIRAEITIFGIIGGCGIVLWFLWNQAIFGDALYFQRGPYSSQKQVGITGLDTSSWFTRNLPHDLWAYLLAIVQVVGLPLFILAMGGLASYLLSQRFRLSRQVGVGLFLLIVPGAFYILSFYSGQVFILIPGALPPGSPVSYFNVRYGIEFLPACAVFSALALSSFRVGRRTRQGPAQIQQIRSVGILVMHSILAFCLFGQALLLLVQGPVITIIDGQQGASCFPYHRTVGYLAQHYNGGLILQDVYSADFDASAAGLDFHEIVYEGSGPLFTTALLHPAQVIQWILFNPTNPRDLVGQAFRNRRGQALLDAQFEPVLREHTGVTLYHLKSRLPLPTRSLPPELIQPYQECPN